MSQNQKKKNVKEWCEVIFLYYHLWKQKTYVHSMCLRLARITALRRSGQASSAAHMHSIFAGTLLPSRSASPNSRNRGRLGRIVEHHGEASVTVYGEMGRKPVLLKNPVSVFVVAGDPWQ